METDWIAKAKEMFKNDQLPDDVRECLWMLAEMHADLKRDLRFLLMNVGGEIHRASIRAKEYGIDVDQT